VKPIIYVAHPVSGDVKANCDKVLKWLRWLTAADPSRIYIAPWVGEVLAHLDMDPIPDTFYDRVLSDDEEVVRRLDGILLTGGRMSTGMKRELAAAFDARKQVFDMHHFETSDDAKLSCSETRGGDGRAFIDAYRRSV
jgi:hypothetical protein